MILILIILIPILGGLLAWLVCRWNVLWTRWISLAALAIQFGLILAQWFGPATQNGVSGISMPWIPQFGISLTLQLDGLSFLLLLLSSLLGMTAIAASWREIQERVGFFHFNLLWIQAALAGVFMSMDLFLFYFFWEMMLVPLYFIIGIWGHENRIYASFKFFIFTQASSLFMLLSIVGLYFLHGQSTGEYTFDYLKLFQTQFSPAAAMLLMLGFFVAFAVKLPVFPLHTWLPDAHTEAPTAGSVYLAGLILKVGAYGFLRFLLPLFPAAVVHISPIAMILGIISILYGAVLAFAQTDLKRMVAYTSVSHMGFVLLGIFSDNQIAQQGAVIIILAHGISTGALFILVGALQERIHTRDLNRMGGLWSVAPRMGRVGLVFALASLGLPGFGNFVGEFLVLAGTYRSHQFIAVFATLGFIVATVYSLWMVQKIFSGPNKENWKFPDLDKRELTVMTVLILVIFWLGLYPQPVIDTSRQAVEMLRQEASISQPGPNLKELTSLDPTPIAMHPGKVKTRTYEEWKP